MTIFTPEQLAALYPIIRRFVFDCSITYANGLRFASVQEAEWARKAKLDAVWREVFGVPPPQRGDGSHDHIHPDPSVALPPPTPEEHGDPEHHP